MPILENGKFCGIPVIRPPGRKCPLLEKTDIILWPGHVVFVLKSDAWGRMRIGIHHPCSVYAIVTRHLRPLLREERLEEEIDISSLQLTHYRLKKIAEHELKLKEGEGDYRLSGAGELGTGTARDPEKEPLSVIIERLNDLFAGESLTEKDRLNYMNTIKDKVLENQKVVQQLENNTPDQVMIGDYPNAVQDAVMDSLQTHNDLASQLLQNENVSKEFARLLLDVILREQLSRKDTSPTP
jgi:type I restriction enzyme R subunit